MKAYAVTDEVRPLEQSSVDRLATFGIEIAAPLSSADAGPNAPETPQQFAHWIPREPASEPLDGLIEHLKQLLVAYQEPGSLPVQLILVPGTPVLRPGPVAILSPAESYSHHELIAGTAFASAGRLRVEHLNGQGSRASATRGAPVARAALRSLVSDWHEHATSQPVSAARERSPRPAAVVVPLTGAVGGGLSHAATDLSLVAAVLREHVDADVIFVVDQVQATRGSAAAEQFSTMVELGVSMSIPAPSFQEPEKAEPASAQKTSPSATQGIRASDIVHVRLTDQALELSNRTQRPVKLRVDLGSVRDETRILAACSVELEPGEQFIAGTEELEGLSTLEPPTAVTRQWSHSVSEVFEGGERRILAVTLALGSDEGAPTHTYSASNGLDFSVNARMLMSLLGESAAEPALPEPVRRAVAEAVDLFGPLESAVRAAAVMLPAG